MTSYESVTGTLEAELAAVADAFAGLTPDQWQRSTLLVRPETLSDDLEWILAASGRAPAGDNRLPLIG
jgi:hypothetical protein